MHISNFCILKERFGEAELAFVNVDETIDFPRPITSKVIYIGGIGNTEPKPLDKVCTTFKRSHL